MSAAAAARDATHQLALDTLHAAGYDVTRALQRLSPNNQPLVKLDEMEQWSASEGNLFEEALCKYGKCFYDIQSDFLPWKHPKSLIEFYYMWKTTDHYIQQKRIKAAEAEHHLKQVYIPNYNKPNPSVLYPNPDGPNAPTGCEGCNAANSLQWYALGPATSPLKVCADCWAYWKRYGDLKAASILDKVSDPSSTNPSHSTNSFTSNDRSGSKPPDMIKPIPHKTLVPPQPPRPAHHHNPSAPTTTGVPDEDQLAAVVGRLVHKPRSGINFHFLAPIPLRVARRLRPICRPVRRQGRRPFKRLASCSALYAETTQLLTKLDSIRAQQLLQLIMCRQTEMSARARTEALHLLFTRIFPNRFPVPANSSQSSSSGPTRLTTSAPCTDADTATVNSKSTNPVSAMNGVTDTDPTTVVAQKRPAPTDDDNPTVSPDHHPAKRALLSEKRVFAATTEKPAVISDTVPNNSTVAVFVGPRRRLGMGTDENGAATLMFRATDTIKRCRRKLLSVTELRRFGRHPWSRRSPNSCTTPNGTEPHSTTDRVNGSVGRESNRDASTIARTNPIGSAGTSARVREEINGPPALNSSPSTANQPVAP
ncbi:Metastasis-associated protein MTA3 [Fasciola hepatica]|uniref:Metastasis-associated protein MTA3 n=1 Tax=Fasciola hepatica TaxID=6192 RepID=A0A4E0RQU3_FASHE|nr:Metastasis-associated protein MTA3 [Fasciola hepatica]